ncbi:MAG: DUF748 domain-containing protein [Bacteroidia bacterium]
MKWLKRIFLFLLITVVGALVLVFIFISPITKYVIEKYDKEYTNREITMDKLWINILTGSMRISGLTVYEENGKDKFFTADELYANITVNKIFASQYEITEAYFKNFSCTIILDGKQFNFDDILKKLASTGPEPKNVKEAPIKYWLKNLKIENSTIIYINKKINHEIEINKLNVSSKLIAWDKNDLLFDLSLAFKSGGTVKGQFAGNIATLAYSINADVEKFGLHAWFPYLKDFMNVKALEGNISTNLLLKGNFNEPQALAAKGKFNMSDFSVVDPLDNPMMTCKSFDVGIDSINVKNGLYNMQQISFTEPYLIFEMYDNGNNFYRLLNDTTQSAAEAVARGEADANLFAMMAGYVEDITKNYVVTNYSANNMIIKNGHMIFNDYTLHEKFHMDLEQMEMNAKNLRSTNESINMQAKSTMNQSGKLVADLSLNPQDFSDLDFNYSVNEMRVSDFNPYMVYYVAFPFLDGIVEYKSTNNIKNHFLKSTNNLTVMSVQLGEKVTKNPLYKLPIKLAVSLLKDNKANIKLDIPVEGDLSDPKYKIGKIIWQVLKNLLIKAATAPYKLLAGMFGGKEEEMKEIKFEYLQNDITDDQYKRLNNVAKVLQSKPELEAELVQVNNIEMEKEFLAVFEMKKQFYFSKNSNVMQDSLSIEALDTIKQTDVHDSLFIQFVNSKATGVDALTPFQDKCKKIIGEENLTEMVYSKMRARNNLILNYLQTKQIPADRFRVINTSNQKEANTQTVSKYLINYFTDNGEGANVNSNANNENK